MFTKITIKNFRCFDILTLENISRLNLIAGMNNVGKTSLLEAIFLILGANIPDLSLRINAFRGVEQFKSNYESMWEWLFNNKNINKTIELIGENQDKTIEKMKIQLTNSDNLIINSEDQENKLAFDSFSTQVKLNELRMNYQKGELQDSSSLIIKSDGSLIGKATNQNINLKPGIFLTSLNRSSIEDVERFSNLEKKNRQNEILNILQLLEPRLKRLAVLLEGRLPIIAGDIGIGELIPITYMGEGISRLLSISLAIATTENGVVLIDEIENGLHHSKITDIWKGINLISSKTKTQIFATTHSLECIKSAHQALRNEKEYDFTYHRLERINNNIQVIIYDQETIETSVEMDFEMR